MCGIVSYFGKKDAVPILIDGLKRLEYRGYDSAGIALMHDGAIKSMKKPPIRRLLTTVIRIASKATSMR